MYVRKAFPFLLILAAIFALPLIAGCGGSEMPADADDESQEGRAVTPETDWSLENVPDVDTGKDQNPYSENADNPPDEDETVGDIGKEFPVPGEVEFEVWVDDVLLPNGMPLEVFDGQHVNLRFHLTAVGSELARYEITTDTVVSLPQRGDLSGYVADVEYVFTFNRTVWREGGVIITVVNKSSSTFMLNVPVVPAEMPGIGGN